MFKETVLDGSTATVWYYPEIGAIHHKFHSFTAGQNFKDVLMSGVPYFQSGKCDKWLSDDRGNGAIPQNDIAWASEEWAPIVIKAGWKKWAIMLPDKMAGKLQYKRLMESYKTMNIDVEVFDNEEEAFAWLKA